MTYLITLLDSLRFIRRFRLWLDARQERRLQAEAAERAHQLAMLDTLFSKVVEFSRSQQEGQLEIAKALTANAGVMTEWLKGFHISDPTPIAPQVVREEWESDDVMKQLAAQLPSEFKLAFELDQFNQQSLEEPGFDRETSDI